jgi:hypothetical protein
VRKDAESVRKPAETERNEATLADTPRACLFREAKPALLALGMSDMNIRSEIVALIEASLKAHPKETALRHQARALKREAEIICGELLIWMQASGLRRGNGGDVRTEVGRGRPSIASLTGFSHRTMLEAVLALAANDLGEAVPLLAGFCCRFRPATAIPRST